MSKRKLRTGFTTGAAGAAAAKAALMLLWGERLSTASVTLPDGGALQIRIERAERLSDSRARASVIKDAGDDPDVTNKAEIVAEVSLIPGRGGRIVEIDGGRGVGRVTRPGLPVSVGEAAINPTPRWMIGEALEEAWQTHGQGPPRVRAVISAPRGEELARHTLNPRLGVVGGLSILGVTGLVKPFSHEAYTATIKSGLSVARAAGLDQAVFTTGGKSEKLAMGLLPHLPETAFVQIADFFGYSLEEAARMGFRLVHVISFFGKAVKQSQGLRYTHAHKAPMDLERLAGLFRAAGAGAALCAETAGANTARHVLDILRRENRLDLAAPVGRGMLAAAAALAGKSVAIRAVILDHDGEVLFEGEQGRAT